jgi:hypothetical protein
MVTNHVNFLTFNGFRPLNVTFQIKPLNTKQCLGNNYQKFRYVVTHDMKVGLICLELKAPIHFNFKCYLSQIKDLITLSKDLR